MTPEQLETARTCLRSAETDSLTFPTLIGRLMDAGFEGYTVDLRRGAATYFLPTGASADLAFPAPPVAPTADFDAKAVQAAIGEAQRAAPGYTYRGFCEKVAQAGCVGYQVSFPGRRVIYLGRTGESHTEHFPR